MQVLLTSLDDNVDLFKQSLGGLPDTQVGVVSFVFTAGAQSTGTAGGVVNTLIAFTLTSSHHRRLLEAAAAEALPQAITDSLTELVGPQLPKDSIVSTEVSSSGSGNVTANVTITVKSYLASARSTVSTFLAADAAGPAALPALVSAKSAMAVQYSPGYVPIIWSTPGSVLEEILNILPYVLGAVGAVAIILTVVGCKYRFVIRSWWDSIVHPVRRQRRESVVGGGIFSRIAGGGGGRLAERGKSEVSSTPDTATNVDEDEFDDYMMRQSATAASS